VKAGLLLVAALVAAPVAAHAQDSAKDTTFHGGPLDGIGMGQVTFVSTGTVGLGLRPSAPNASPLPAVLAQPVGGILKAYEGRDETALAGYFAREATAELCLKGMAGECTKANLSFSSQFAEHCDHNTPYFMKDKGQVRIEWLYKGQLYYISFLDMRDGKITHIRTLVADVPPVFRANSISKAEKTNG